MDKGNGQINKKLLLPQSWSDNHSNYILPQSVASIKNKKESNESNIIDYKNISLAMTGKLLSQPLKSPSFLLSTPCEIGISLLYRRNKFRLYT